jgi:enterochelin esterase-like enzyme
MKGPRRRTVVKGAVGLAALGAIGAVFARTPTTRELIHVSQGRLESAYRKGIPSAWTIVWPPGVFPAQPVLPAGGRVPVVVALHGKGGSDSVLHDLGLDVALEAAVNAGMPPFALAAIEGGDTYWHPRKDGTDTGRMVMEEFLPRLAETGLAAGPTYRVALMGWSMGGYGALRIAEQLGPDRVRAVSVASPALWLRAGDSAPGAFDDAEDFRREDVFSRRAALKGIALQVDCGQSDPFVDATRAFVSGLPEPAQTSFGPGGHDATYWRSITAAQVSFLGKALAGTTV